MLLFGSRKAVVWPTSCGYSAVVRQLSGRCQAVIRYFLRKSLDIQPCTPNDLLVFLIKILGVNILFPLFYIGSLKGMHHCM